jgi:FAD/FMN-containing dehydrogenase
MSEFPEGIRAARGHLWKNQPAENLSQRVHTLYEVGNQGADPREWWGAVHNLRYVIEQAQLHGRRVRPAGATWSMSPLVPTEDYVVDMRRLDSMLAPPGPEEVLPGVEASRLAHVQSGAPVGLVNARLRAAGRALRVFGALQGQSLFGAMCTGTHASVLGRGAMGDYARALHLITEGGRSLWLERASNHRVHVSWEAGTQGPVTLPSFAERLGAELVRNDELFDAALVGLGSFGLVHSVLVEVDMLRDFRMYRQRQELDGALRHALRTLDFTGLALPGGGARPYHFEVAILPHAAQPGRRGAYVTTLYASPSEARGPAMSPPVDALARVIAGLFQHAERLTPRVAREIFEEQCTDVEACGSIGELFAPPSASVAARFRPIGSEVGVPLADAERALDAILQVVEEHWRGEPAYCFPGFIVLRYVWPTHALLGFNRFAPTCTLGMPALGDVPGTESFYARVWQELARQGISYTLHWGQLGSFDSASLRHMYGANVERWRAARRELLSPQGRRLFSNHFLEQAGLAD